MDKISNQCAKNQRNVEKHTVFDKDRCRPNTVSCDI